MIRACRIAGRWPDTLVGFLDELFIAKGLFRLITPEFFPNFFMHVFGESLGQAVCQSFYHKRVVVILLFFVLSG